MHYDTLNVNLWGGTCVGKTEVASYLVSTLKRSGISCALVQEYSSELAWQGKLTKTEQLLITTEQYRRQAYLQGQVQVVVTEGAIPLGVLHAPESYRKSLAQIVSTLTADWRHFDYLIGRDLTKNYDPEGRLETQEEAIAHHERVCVFARQWSPSIHEELHPDEAPELILADILCSLNEPGQR
jgi:tRNA uridine 5-carbamoylmethylation protein Kti12